MKKYTVTKKNVIDKIWSFAADYCYLDFLNSNVSRFPEMKKRIKKQTKVVKSRMRAFKKFFEEINEKEI